MTPTCANCRYFHPITSPAFPDADGMCRRYAPQGVVVGCQSNGWQTFPPMMGGQWCGEHDPVVVLANAQRAAA